MLTKLTNDLQQACLQLKDKFLTNEPPTDVRDPVFFNQVKTETEPLFKLIEEWEKQALNAVKQRKVLVHPQQVQSTRENFELILLHSYYIDVKPQRYMELLQAIDYVCDSLK
ncbi:DUF1798 family protein [Amphibacillus indicireducens]|uniref:DUF1798 family protein n=1 Tax=Amphibacillus indicireducens TaxID=1076330 RepID=A0ABP7VRV2_9BACI